MRAALLSLLVPALAAAEARTVDERPWYARIDNGFGAPTGLLGLAVGRTVQSSLVLELGGGVGITGYQIAALARVYQPVGDSSTVSWTFAAGPSLALMSQALGLHVYHRDDMPIARGAVYYMALLNVEIGLEARWRWGGLIRVALGGYLNVRETISGLCAHDPGVAEEPAGCEPAIDFPSPPEVARRRALPYFVFGYGFAW